MINQWNCPFYDDLKPDSFPKIQTINMFRERIKWASVEGRDTLHKMLPWQFFETGHFIFCCAVSVKYCAKGP